MGDSAVDLVEHSAQVDSPAVSASTAGKVDVVLALARRCETKPLSSSVRIMLEMLVYARSRSMRSRTSVTVPRRGPQHAHDVQLALGEMQVVLIDDRFAWCARPHAHGWGVLDGWHRQHEDEQRSSRQGQKAALGQAQGCRRERAVSRRSSMPARPPAPAAGVGPLRESMLRDSQQQPSVRPAVAERRDDAPVAVISIARLRREAATTARRSMEPGSGTMMPGRGHWSRATAGARSS